MHRFFDLWLTFSPWRFLIVRRGASCKLDLLVACLRCQGPRAKGWIQLTLENAYEEAHQYKHREEHNLHTA